MPATAKEYDRPSWTYLAHLREYAERDLAVFVPVGAAQIQKVIMVMFAEIDALKAESEDREHTTYVAGYHRGFIDRHVWDCGGDDACPEGWPEFGWSHYQAERGNR